MPDLKIFTVGGTIDKIYFDQKSAYQVGDPKIVEVLEEANVTVEFETESIMQKDSLDMDENLTGSMQPARFKNSDAAFNIGCAIAAVQALPQGIYLTMNGLIFDPFSSRKNVDMNRFEKI